MKKSFNIAIDGLSGVGKSPIRYQVAKQLKFTFIDSGLFYRYIADRFYLDDTIQLNEIYLFKDEMIVVGRDVATNILPNAEVKLVLEADFETRVYRRTKQLNAKEFEAIGKVFSDMLKRDMDSFDLILEAKKVATIIDTTNLSIEQVIAKILTRVLWVKYGNNDIFTSNSQEELFTPQEGSSTSQTNDKYIVPELIELKTWQLANYVTDKMYSKLISNLKERYELLRYLKELHELCVTEYEKIERDVLPKNHSNNRELYKKAQEWRKTMLTKSKNSAKFQASHLNTMLLDLENEIDEQEQEEEKKIKKQKN
ncbi:cytidylate kinase [Gigaspora margarita]|uniref:(d)CMP kinase n=1 Tax=Gigaspora margarita TaxID=4874 RepID=A0A8H4EI14_GIGMA|nr:cytidylate kinase [Gigaspora margarita]